MSSKKEDNDKSIPNKPPKRIVLVCEDIMVVDLFIFVCMRVRNILEVIKDKIKLFLK